MIRIIVLMFVLCSCATSPVNINDAILVKNESKFSGENEIVFIRDSGFTGSGCSIVLSINGEKIAELDNSEKTIVKLPTGEHQFEIKTNNNICMNGKIISRSFYIQSSKKFRISADPMDIFN